MSTKTLLLSLVLFPLLFEGSILRGQSVQFIKDTQPVAVHRADFKPLPSGKLVISKVSGEITANYRPGPGDFHLFARLKILNFGQTDGIFNLCGNLFGFDGRLRDYFVNGHIFGSGVKSLGEAGKSVSEGRFFNFEIIRKDNKIRFLIDGKEIIQVTGDFIFNNPMGFRPNKAKILISEWRGEGNWVRVSPKPPFFTLPIIDVAHETSRQEIIDRENRVFIGQPGVIQSPDGHEMAMILPDNDGQYNSVVIFSTDEGRTWTPPAELPSSLSGDRHQCLYAPDKRLVITFRDCARESPTTNDFVAWVGRYQDLKAGAEGQYRIRLLDNLSEWDGSYPVFELLPGGSFLAATYGKWDRDQKKSFKGVHFKLDEIDAKYRQLPDVVDVFVNEKEGYDTYRIPALLYTVKGTLLAFAEGRSSLSDHAENDIVLKRSQNRGASWLPLQVVAEDGANSLNNPLVVQDKKTGRVLLMYQRYPRSHDERSVGPGYESDTICRTYLIHSDDDGVHWSSPKDITRQVKRPTWVTSTASGPGNGIQLKHGAHKGRLIMPFNQGPYGKWRVYAVFSDDHGRHWQWGEVAFEKDKGLGNEVQMAELSDGSVMLNSRSAYGKKYRKTAISRDGGVNWTGLRDEKQLIEPQCMGSFISLNHTGYEPPPLLYAGPGSQKSRKFGTIYVSLDDGFTWGYNRCLYNGAYAYSSLTDMDKGRFGLLFERDGYQKISFLTQTLEDLLRDE
ncbi:MAG: exo-alpha-sialidase [Bacteroidales bacterium]|nr:exo-alpha-sialidase [Bacteroidales bacterium]